MNPIKEEPALVISGIGAIIGAGIALAIAFGVPITPDQKVALTTFIGLIVTVTTGWFIRGQVSSVSKVATVLGVSTEAANTLLKKTDQTATPATPPSTTPSA